MKSNNIILKTGVSVLVSIFISKLLHLKYPFFVALPSFVPISNSAAESLKAGRNRMLGTLIGAFLGIVFAFIKPGSAVLCGLGISIIIYLCNYIRWGSSASIAGLVFISIMVSIKGENPILYSVERISNTFIGILVTIIVNNLIFQTNFVCEVENSCRNIRLTILNLIKDKFIDKKDIKFEKLDIELEEAKREINNYFEEYTFRKTTKNKITQFNNIVDMFVCINLHLKILNSIGYTYNINKENSEAFKKLLSVDYNFEEYSNNEMNIIFNYHLEKIFEKLSCIDRSLEISVK